MKVPNLKNEDAPSPSGEDMVIIQTTPILTKKELKKVLTSVDGIGEKKFDKIMDQIGEPEEIVGILEQSPSILLNIKGFTKRLVDKISIAWEEFKSKN
jgi:hypothetical protein